MPLIENLNEGFIDNINNYDGYFPDIQWQINDNKLKMISGNPNLQIAICQREILKI